MAKTFKTVHDALEAAATLALHQRIDVGGRMAEVVYGAEGKTIQFNTSHDTSTARPDDGRVYNKGAEISGQKA